MWILFDKHLKIRCNRNLRRIHWPDFIALGLKVKKNLIRRLKYAYTSIKRLQKAISVRFDIDEEE